MRRTALLIALTLLCAGETSAGNFWEQTNGPFGGDVHNLSVDPGTSAILAGTDNGIYRSVNNDDGWSRIGLADMRIRSIAINDQSHIFAGTDTGLLRSLDTGGSWEQLNQEVATTVYAIDINSSGHLFAAFVGGLFRSTDNGDSWININEYLPVRAILIAPDDDIFLGPQWGMHAFDGGIYRSTDNGDSWEHFEEGLPRYGGDYYSFAIDADGDIFAAISGSGIFRSTDDGESWSGVSSGLPTGNIRSLAVGTDSRLFAGTYGYGIFLSTNDGDDWSEINNGMRSDDVHSIAPTSGGEIMTGTRSGIFRSSNNGGSWTETSEGLNNADVRCMAVTQMDEIFAGTWGNGVFRSTDRGNSWVDVDEEISDIDITGIALTTEGHLFVSTYHDGVFRSTDGGTHWSRVTTGLTPEHVTAIAAGPGDVLFAGISNSSEPGDIFRSTNEGETWSMVYEETTVSSITSLGIDSEGNIFASACCGGRMLRSLDNGDSWFEVIHVGVVPESIIFDSQDHVFFGTLGKYGIYRSTDHGEDWEPLSETIVAKALAVDSSDGIFAGTPDGRVFHSTDDGESWVDISDGLPNDFIYSLAADLTDFIYVGMSDHGILRSIDAPVFIEGDDQAGPGLPLGFFLSQNYPNPFNPSTTIEFHVPENAEDGVHVKVDIYDLRGRLLKDLLSENKVPGNYEVHWDGRDNRGTALGSGTYLCRIEAGTFQSTRKLLIIR